MRAPWASIRSFLLASRLFRRFFQSQYSIPVHRTMTRNMAPRADTAATAQMDVPPVLSCKMLPLPDPFSESVCVGGRVSTGLAPPSTSTAPISSSPSSSSRSRSCNALKNDSPSPGIAKASIVAASNSSLDGAPLLAGKVTTPPRYEERT